MVPASRKLRASPRGGLGRSSGRRESDRTLGVPVPVLGLPFSLAFSHSRTARKIVYGHAYGAQSSEQAIPQLELTRPHLFALDAHALEKQQSTLHR